MNLSTLVLLDEPSHKPLSLRPKKHEYKSLLFPVMNDLKAVELLLNQHLHQAYELQNCVLGNE